MLFLEDGIVKMDCHHLFFNTSYQLLDNRAEI